ncbi:hypothetical protein [Planococcus glaciei]|uniref:hypothetical protein n=1 Tax=Planococcus glaciei TaxID=459472 RepID=UPI0009437414|nr:hypothetical protein [Planococcus glaciei]
MEKPKSFKESMVEIKNQFKEDQQRNNAKFKADREQNKIQNAERKEEIKKTAQIKKQEQQQTQIQSAPVEAPIVRATKAPKKPKPKSRRRSSLDTSGGKNDVFNLFAQMLLGLILSIPIFLIGLLVLVFIVMFIWTSIF